MAKRTFYQEMARNRRNSLLLVIVVSLVLFGLIYTIGFIFAPDAIIVVIPVAIIIIVIYTWSSYQYGDQVVLSSVKAQPADGPQYVYLRDTVEGLAIAAGIPPPKVYVMESPEINAFATGRDPEHASIAVTTGALSALNRQELEGVVAHEMSHVRNRDVEFMMLVAVLVGLASILSHIIIRGLWFGGGRRRGRDREGGNGLEILVLVIGVILAIIAPVLVRIVQLAVSRSREYLADSNGAELTRYPEGLASALEKIEKGNQGNMDVDEAVSPLFISDPRHTALDAIWATHPPLEERIKRLREM